MTTNKVDKATSVAGMGKWGECPYADYGAEGHASFQTDDAGLALDPCHGKGKRVLWRMLRKANSTP